MFKSTLLTTFFALLCNGIAHVDARAVAAGDSVSDHVIKRSTTLTQRDVVIPPITYPTTGTIWNVGERHNCTWDTSVIPPGFKANGMIVLGFLEDGDDSEHLDLDNPLAKGFPITDGRTEITVPAVTTRNTYILVLFGDSGNASGKFTIKNISIGQPSSSSAPSSPTSSGQSASSASTGTSSGGFNIGGINGTATISSTPLASAPGTPTASVPSSVATSTAPASPTSSLPVSTASLPSTASAAADGANPTTTPNNNAGTRAVPFGVSATWISTVCSLAAVLGWLL